MCKCEEKLSLEDFEVICNNIMHVHINYPICYSHFQEHCDVCPELAAVKPKGADPVSKTLAIIFILASLIVDGIVSR